ncbi:MAG: leucine-rich repeat protein [Ruminococcus sp.]|nr:leucine-rich repeat protein [Ruminococcus sp.]
MKSSKFKKLTALMISVMLVFSMCVTGISASAAETTNYYLFGWINGANYACEEDYTNMGEYVFVDGKLTTTFDETSYVAVKAEDNAGWYMTDGWLGDVTEATLYNTSTLGTNANKLMVPGGVSVTFTLVDNGDDTFTLSYEETAEEPTTVEVTEAPTTEPVTEPATEPTTVPASEYEYTVLEDGTAEVTGYTGNDTVLTIPSSIDGYAVSSIGSKAFYQNTDITAVTVSDGITSIGDSAFSGCSSLADITVADSVTALGYSAFEGTAITELPKLSDSIRYYSGSLFKSCTKLESITIPENITSIGASAFSSCTGLTKITFSDNITTLYEGAFSNCKSIKELDLPKNLRYVYRSAFTGCSALTKVSFPENLTAINDYMFESCSSLESIVIPDNMTSIGFGSFKNCTALKSIVIPARVSSIQSKAFENCSNLTIYGYTGTATETYAVNNSISFVALEPHFLYTVLEDGTAEITGYNGGDTNITIPSEIDGYAVTSIGKEAFASRKFESVTIPEGVTNIGKDAFYCNYYLKSVNLPESITTIGELAFNYCTKLSNVTLPENLTTIGHHAFYGCQTFTSVTIPSKVTTIGYLAFASCSSLTNVTFENNETIISDDMLLDCDNATVYGYLGSTAETYATANSINFVALDSVSITGDINLDLAYSNGVFTATTTLGAGAYSFKIENNGTAYGGNYVFTDSMSGVLYCSDWKKATTLNTTGGEYTFTFDPATDKLTVTHKKVTADSVKLTGDIDLTLAKSASDANVFTATADIEAGTYQFKINADGTEYGCGSTFTGEMNNVLYSKDWKKATTFITDGGKYTFTFNMKTNKLSVLCQKEISTVMVIGDIDLALTQSEDNANVFTAETVLEAGTYQLKISVDGVEYGCGCTFNNMYKAEYNADWNSSTTFNTNGGSYSFTFDTSANQLVVIPVK